MSPSELLSSFVLETTTMRTLKLDAAKLIFFHREYG